MENPQENTHKPDPLMGKSLEEIQAALLSGELILIPTGQLEKLLVANESLTQNYREMVLDIKEVGKCLLAIGQEVQKGGMTLISQALSGRPLFGPEIEKISEFLDKYSPIMEAEIPQLESPENPEKPTNPEPAGQNSKPTTKKKSGEG